jgi:AraC-like DNA-binding protein
MRSSATASAPYRPSQLHAAVERWQQFVLSLDQFSKSALFGEANLLVREMPIPANLSDELVGRVIVAEVLSGLMHHAQLSDDPRLTSSLMRLFGSLRATGWTADVVAFLDDCASVVESRAGDPLSSHRMSVLSRRAVRTLDDRYREPLLDEPGFAESLGTSTSNLAHTLKYHTGMTFLQHLHRRRTEDAFRQLTTSSRCVEEIATRVGYSGGTQLRRHLLERYGLTARGIRAGKPPRDRYAHLRQNLSETCRN